MIDKDLAGYLATAINLTISSTLALQKQVIQLEERINKIEEEQNHERKQIPT